MKLGMVGLGRMGAGMTERLQRDGHEVMTYDPNVESTADSLAELIRQLDRPRVVWVMVPAGEITESTVRELLELLGRDDVLVDGGNSNFRDSQRRAREASERGLYFVDVGVSGGIWGLQEGFCLMAGGAEEAIERLEPVFRSLAPQGGYAHVGPSGAGHFVKMVHNGIEYGLMQSYAEGFDILHHSEFDLDLEEISGIWRYGSVVRSWLLELLHDAFDAHGGDLASIAGYVDDSGEGRWTVGEAVNEAVPAPVISAALFARFVSREDESFAAKINAALRQQFGGHAVKTDVSEGQSP
ncbi:MAG TPA: decarboxylating 6-phosphogluconate dehydrogenase [Gaiellaceae bacterium]|nr:decarboxylating 6-phosphogluconate dehydrogenase [Gaiellaceae bacterium]